MSTQISTIPIAEHQAALQEIAALKKQVSDLNRKLEQAQNTIKYLQPFKQKYEFYRKLDRIDNKVASATTKQVFKSVKQVIETGTPQDDGFYPVVREHIGTPVGLSEVTAGNKLHKLEEAGLIEIKTVKDDIGHDHLRIKPKNFTLEALAQSEPTNHGGAREYCICPECRSKRTHFRRISGYEVTCESCGVISILETNNPKHKAFIVDEETYETWEETYLPEQVTGAEFNLNSAPPPAMQPEFNLNSAPVDQAQPATEVPFTYKHPKTTPAVAPDDIPPPPEPDDIASSYEPTPPVEVRPNTKHYADMPSWYKVGTPDWNKQIAHLKRMHGEKYDAAGDLAERRQLWLAQHERGLQA